MVRPEERRAFVVLEGGGAKGVAHVGALSAVEAEGYRIDGLAGTSAGALVAALRAAGFGPRDLIDVGSDASVLDRLTPPARHATDLLGRRGWFAIRLAREIERGWISPAFLIALAAALLFLLGACYRLGGAAVAFVVLVGLVVVAAAVGVVAVRQLIGGLASLRGFRRQVAQLLSNQVHGSGADRPVLFRDFGPGTDRPTLKIVATNISRGAMQVFSPQTTPDVAVADAVAASVCIPLIFSVASVPMGAENGRPDLFLDGGLLSNLPAWVFDDERTIDRDARTICVELAPTAVESPPNGRIGWVKRAVRTTVFGARDLNLRSMDHVILIPIPCDFGILDFDRGKHAIRRVVRDAESEALLRLREVALRDRRAEGVRKLAVDSHAATCRETGYSAFPGRIRVSIAEVSRASLEHHLKFKRHDLVVRLAFQAGFEGAPDEGLALPLDRSLVGLSFREGGALFVDRESGLLDAFRSDDPRDRWWVSRLSVDLQWVLVIPISNGGQRDALAIAIDSDSALPVEGDFKLRYLNAMVTSIGEVFGLASPK
jgi:NTE family protein